MTFGLYLVGLTLLLLYLHRAERDFGGLYLVAYHFIAIYLIFIRYHIFAGDLLQAGWAHTLSLSLYEAAMAMTLQIEVGMLSVGEILICFVGSVLTYGALIYAFFHRTINRMLVRLRIAFAPRLIILVGEHRDACALAEDIRRHAAGDPSLKRVPLIYIRPEEMKERQQEEAGSGKAGLYEADEHFFRSAPRKKPCDMVLLPDLNNSNISRLYEMNRAEYRENLRVTAFLPDDLLRFEELHFDNLNAYYVSDEMLCAGAFLRAHPPIALLRDKGLTRKRSHVETPVRPFRLCIIGYDTLTEEYLLSAYENTGFETEKGGWGMEAVIVDYETDTAKGKAAFHAAREDLYTDVPYFLQEKAISWKRRGDGDAGLMELFAADAEPFDQVLAGTLESEENVRIALRIIRTLRRQEQPLPQIIVTLREPATGSMALLQDEENVFFLHAGEDQYTYDALIRRIADEEAQQLHEGYRRQAKDNTKWNALGTFLQESNRAAALDAANKRILSGDISALTDAEKASVYETLGIYEHRRWCAFHYTRGWTVLPAAELTQEEKESFRLKRPGERRHACLVEWDALDALPQQKPGLLKQYDMETVRAQIGGDRETG